MNKLIYFFVLVLFLLLIKTIVFKKEHFHPLDQGAASREAANETAFRRSEAERAAATEAQEAEIQQKREALEAAGTTFEAALAAFEEAVTENDKNEALQAVTEALERLNGLQREVGIDETEFEDPTITTPPSLPAGTPLSGSQEQQRRLGIDHNIPNRTIQSEGDNMCCGINIYETKLENIGKCISQHIDQTGELEDPKFIEWKNEETECRNPHRILSRTSNCSDIVNKFNPSIKTLLDIIKDTSCEKCDYNRYLQDLSSIQNDELTDNQKLLIFQKRIACELRGQNEIGNDKLIINDIEFEINECGEPNGSIRVGGCD